MINAKMRFYKYYKYTDDNGYGQPQLSKEPVGNIKMAINTTSQSIQDNINYQGAAYLGLTLSNLLDDTCVIQYGTKKLKVLYVNPEGKLKQVFMAEI